MSSVKVIVVGGPFASGKTTLLMKMLEVLTRGGRRVGLLMNDVGPVDYKMVASLTNCPVEEVSRHCMCMKQNDLKDALRKLLASDHDTLLIEEIGFGNPHKCWTTLSEILPTISPNTELTAITVVVDGEYLLRSYQGFVSSMPPVMAQQLSEAEIIVINKVDLLKLESLNQIREIVADVNDRAKILYISALTGMGVESLLELAISSKWSHGAARAPEEVMKRRTEWFSDMVWSAYKVSLQLDAEEAITDAIGKTLLELGKGIIKSGGEIVRIKSYSDHPAGKIYLSITPDLRMEYRPGAYTGEKVKSFKFTLSCVVKGVEVGDVTAALKAALSKFKGSFIMTRV
jgi:G3E family GTPase